MKPDEKYMSEVNLKNDNNFNFIPPSFNRSLMMNDSDNLSDENGPNTQSGSYYSNGQSGSNNPYGQNYSNNQNNPNYSNNQNGSNNQYGPNYSTTQNKTNYTSGQNSMKNSNNQNYSNGQNGSNNSSNQNNSNNSNNTTSNQFLDLYPDETASSELYCYFNSLTGCKNNTQTKNNMNNNRDNRTPTTFEILRDFDLDLDESVDLTRSEHNTAIDDIFSEIQSKHAGIFDTFSAYNIPEPISKLITKRLIKLSLLYSNKE